MTDDDAIKELQGWSPHGDRFRAAALDHAIDAIRERQTAALAERERIIACLDRHCPGWGGAVRRAIEEGEQS
jgi:hypothetical protein